MKRNVALLSGCQGLVHTALALLIAVSALTGAMLAEDKTLATLPHAVMWLATMATSPIASTLMDRIGRRGGFLIGAVLGIASGLVCALAVFRHEFGTFVAGMALFGAFNSVAMFYRFAAAEAADPAFRARAISLVIGGGIIAAFVGPELAKWSKDLFAPTAFAGAFFVLAALPVLMMGLLAFVDLPAPARPTREAPARPLAEIARQPEFIVALLAAMLGWGTMVLVMTATPLSIVAGGYIFDDAAFVVQWHMVAMFAPSLATGWLIERLGLANVMLAGLALVVASVGAGLWGHNLMAFWWTNVLVGAGWNFLFVGATAMLGNCYRPSERAKVEGFNDFLVFGAVALSSFVSGYLQHAYGWDTVLYTVLPQVAVVAAAVLWLRIAARVRPAE